jgi:hypothetical protein
MRAAGAVAARGSRVPCCTAGAALERCTSALVYHAPAGYRATLHSGWVTWKTTVMAWYQFHALPSGRQIRRGQISSGL